MDVGKLVRRVAAPILAEAGFSEAPSGHRGEWVFARLEGGVAQGARYTARGMRLNGVMTYEMELEFRAAAPGVSAFPFGLGRVVEHVPPEANSWIRFITTEEEMSGYLAASAKVTVESVVPLFGCMARPMVIPAKDMDVDLAAGTVQKAEVFRAAHGLAWASGHGEIIGLMEGAQDAVRAVQGRPLTEAWGTLVGASAYVGELVRRVFGGEWMWEPNFKETYLVCSVGGIAGRYAGSLGVTVNYWTWPELYGCWMTTHFRENVLRWMQLSEGD